MMMMMIGCTRHTRHPTHPPTHHQLNPTQTRQGGNDYEIFVSPDTVGHTVVGPDDTIRQLRELFPSPA